MLKKLQLFVAAASVAATPCLAADLEPSQSQGERRTGAVAGAYLTIPFGGARSGKTQSGFRLQMTHDYRNATAPNAQVVRSNTFDLRLVGDKQTTLYVANMPVTGKEARKLNMAGGGGIMSIVIIAAAVVGSYLLYKEVIDDDDDDNDNQ